MKSTGRPSYTADWATVVGVFAVAGVCMRSAAGMNHYALVARDLLPADAADILRTTTTAANAIACVHACDEVVHG